MNDDATVAVIQPPHEKVKTRLLADHFGHRIDLGPLHPDGTGASFTCRECGEDVLEIPAVQS